MRLPDYYEFCSRITIVAGPDALEQIPALLATREGSRPMILTDRGGMAAGPADRVTEAMGDGMAIAAVKEDIPPEAEVKTISRLAGVFRKNACNAIIAIGGGGVPDTAKGLNILVSEDTDDLAAHTGAGIIKRPLHPFIALPTSIETGSAVTPAAVITDPDNDRELPFTSPFLLPHAVVIDPRMMLPLSRPITSAAAVAAMARAVEAYTMLSQNPLSDAHALEALTLIRNHLFPVIETPAHTEGQLALVSAAAMADIAASNAMPGLVHALGHAAASVCGVPRNTCTAILLPYGLEYNRHKIEDRIADLLLHLAGPDLFARTPENNRAAAAIQWIRDLNLRLNRATGGRHATCLREIQDAEDNAMVSRQALPAIAKKALGNVALLYNPEEADYNDLLKVADAAWEGIGLTKGDSL